MRYKNPFDDWINTHQNSFVGVLGVGVFNLFSSKRFYNLQAYFKMRKNNKNFNSIWIININYLYTAVNGNKYCTACPLILYKNVGNHFIYNNMTRDFLFVSAMQKASVWPWSHAVVHGCQGSWPVTPPLSHPPPHIPAPQKRIST